MLKVNDLSVSYGEKQPLILQNLSFDLQRGSILNILGQNAVGKTTLIRCLIRELTNYDGQIMIDDQDVRSFSIKEYAKKVGVVSASFQAYQNLLVADYLLTGFANQLSNFSRPSKTLVEKAYAILDGFNKPELFNKQINQLSSGEMQLVMIARVIIQDPQIIIVDEPTANLDVKNQIFVLEQIVQLSKQGYTVIITTHNPGHAVSLGGKTLLMGKRKYVFGDTAEVISSDRLTEYYGLNVMIQKESDYQVIVFTEGESNAIKLVL
jgi:iron complex transport system ATP-binding protein